MTLNANEFDESIKYSGTGAEHNNFLAEKALLQEQLFDRDFDTMGEAELDEAFDLVKKQMTEFIDKATTIDTMITNDSRDRFNATLESYQNYYGQIITLRKELPEGSPSPVWKDYENYNGGTSSLSDLKGKYVYVDVWATWCGPCKVEIPHLKKLEAEMHGKNIAFVSMSIDDAKTHKGSWEQANLDWKAMVADKELSGIQIMAPKGWESDFVKAYKINGIPRFILIDPSGNVVDPNAPRPSSPKLKEKLEALL
jgi:thiol-disulfide isomerase/thioredoxin